MKINITKIDGLTVTMTANCKAFIGEEAEKHYIQVDLDRFIETAVIISVFCDLSDYYTTKHSLTEWHKVRFENAAKEAFTAMIDADMTDLIDGLEEALNED